MWFYSSFSFALNFKKKLSMKNLDLMKLVRVREEMFQQVEALRQAAREGRLFILPAEVMNQVAALATGNDLIQTKAPTDGRSVPAAVPLSEADKREESIQAILTYVARIDDCAEEAYRPHIRAIWEAILRSEKLGDLFFLYRYTQTSGNPNWYRVTATVEVLQQKRVYRPEFSLPDLHRRMELLKPDDKPKSSYSSKDRYCLNRREKEELSNIIRIARKS